MVMNDNKETSFTKFVYLYLQWFINHRHGTLLAHQSHWCI